MNSMKIYMLLIPFLLLSSLSTSVYGEDVYVQNFDGNWPFDGWTDYNPDHGGKFEWESLKSMTCEGTGAIAHTSEDYAARTWVASPAFSLVSNRTYICSFQERAGNENFPEKMATYIWKGSPADFDPQDAAAILIWRDVDVTNTQCELGTKSFAVSITGQDYHVVFYCTSNAKEYLAIWDDLVVQNISLPTVTTTPASHITSTTAESGGDVTSDGGATVTSRGVCWGLNANPTVSGSHSVDGSGTGSFTSSITGLFPGSTYHVRAYATNKNGTAYGRDLSFTEGSLPPTVSTSEVTLITSTTAESGGDVTSDGGATVTTRGVCWSLNLNPTVSDSHSVDGSGTGSFTSSITGLSSGKTYHVRAYARNANGTAYGVDVKFVTESTFPTVVTTPITEITGSDAESGGNVASDGGATVTSRGVCWSLNLNPTVSDSHSVDGSGTGSFTSSITGLSSGKTYHVRAYATNSNGTSYGDDLMFKTKSTAPSVRTTAASHITSTTAESGGIVTSDGGATVTARGVCWSLSANPTVSGSHSSDGSGTGVFRSGITGLGADKTYHVRAYATNMNGTSYGDDLTFTTSSTLPAVRTTVVSHITETTAETGGNVIDDGGSAVTGRGVCWSVNPNPTTAGRHTFDGTGTGSFISEVTGLSPGMRYYARAYATNANGTAYGGELAFSTTLSQPTVTTTPASHITSTTAESGGNVTGDGGAAVTERGVCWSFNANPTILDSHSVDGKGLGVFTSEISGLLPGRTYHVRAYATNAEGTGYGRDLTFTEGSLPPSVTTGSPTQITSTTAESGGNVTSDGGTTVTARGVCWSLNANPTTASSHTLNGSGTGAFESDISGLTPGKTYYVRAYATNANGTSYGKNLNFTSLSAMPKVMTTPATHTTSTTAQSGGNVTSDGGATVTSRGVCWGLNPNPTTASSHTMDGSGTGAFESHISGLEPGKTYHVRAYATNANGTSYGKDISFTEGSEIPTVFTSEVRDITSKSAKSGGNVTSDGGTTVTSRGICWGIEINPTLKDSHTDDGSGIGFFYSNMTGLKKGTEYHVRAYATNANGTAYGKDISFKSGTVAPTVYTASPTHLTPTTAESGGDVTEDGGDTVQARGVCWSHNSNPTISDSHSIDGSGLGFFKSEMEGLSPGETYHVRAYARNNHGTGYGRDLAFKEDAEIPSLSTDLVTNITANTAKSGGNVTDEGGATVSERGVCWSENQNPTIGDSHTVNEWGGGAFASELTGLAPETTYHVRAYATNSVGTGYGEDLSFVTARPAPYIDTFDPVRGGRGTTVTIRGLNFEKANAVRFGGTDAQEFVVSSDTEIVAVVGNGSSGYLTVVSSDGTGSSREEFTYTGKPIPAIDEWGIIGLIFLLLLLGYRTIRKHAYP